MLLLEVLLSFSELGNIPYDSMSFNVLAWVVMLCNIDLMLYIQLMLRCMLFWDLACLTNVSVCQLAQCWIMCMIGNNIVGVHILGSILQWIQSLSQYVSMDRFSCGSIMRGLSLLHCNYLGMNFTAFSCKALGSLENHAHWWAANDMYGWKFCGRQLCPMHLVTVK
jgi:hypothetical protein